jgi:hypothetical protein
MPDIAIVRQAARTTTGIQSFTKAELGPCIGAFFVITAAVTDGVAADALRYGYGSTDGTNQWAVSIFSDHGVATTDTGRNSKNNCFMLTTVSAAALDGLAQFFQFVADGIEVNVTNAFSAGFLVTCFLIPANPGWQARTLTIDNDQGTVSTVGFEADVGIAVGIRGDIGTSGNQARLSLGYFHNDRAGTITERCIAFEDRDSRTVNTEGAGFLPTDAVAALLAFGVEDWQTSLSNFTSVGFDATVTGSAGDDIGLFLLRLGSAPSKVFSLDPPTAGGDFDLPDLGFTPTFVSLGLSMLTAEDIADTTEASVLGIAAFTAAEECCNTCAAEDGIALGVTNTQSLSDDQVVNLDDHAGVAAFAATYVNMLPLSARLNFSAADGTQRKWIGLAIGANVEQIVGATVSQHVSIARKWRGLD